MSKIVVPAGAASRHVVPRRSMASVIATAVAWVLALGAGAALAYTVMQTNARIAAAKTADQAAATATAAALAKQSAALEARAAAAAAAVKAQDEQQKALKEAVKALEADKQSLASDLKRKEAQQSKAADHLQESSEAVRTALAGVASNAALGESEDDKLAGLAKVRDALKKQVNDAETAKAERERADADREAKRKPAAGAPGAPVAAKADEQAFDYKRYLKLEVSVTATKGKYRYNVHLQNTDFKQDLMGLHLTVLAYSENDGQYTLFLKDEADCDIKHVGNFDYRTVDGYSSTKKDGWLAVVTDKDNKVVRMATNTEALSPYVEKIRALKQGQMFNRHGGLVTPPPTPAVVIGPDGKQIIVAPTPVGIH